MIKRFFQFSFILVLIHTPLCGYFVCQKSPASILSQAINEEVAREIAKRYGLDYVGFGGSVHDVIEKMSLSFACYREMSLDDYKRLVIHCTQDYLKKINGHQEAQQFLRPYPFDANHIELSIFVFDEKKRILKGGKLTCIGVMKGNICYERVKKGRYMECFKVENFEEMKQERQRELLSLECRR